MASDDYAIVVGIKTYPAFTPLESPEVDAKDFRDWLISPDGGQVPNANVDLIISSDYPVPQQVDDAKPTLDAIDGVFKKYVRLAFTRANHRVGRRLYIFFTGHGITPGLAPAPDLDDAALLMANADLMNLGLHVPGHPYADWFRNAGAFEEIVLFMDCCRDAMDKVVPRYPPFSPLGGDRNSVRRFYASATQWNSEAWEDVLGSSNVKRSLFTFVVLEALRSSLADAQGRLTGNVLAGYVQSRLNQLRGDQLSQLPQFTYDPQSDIVLVERTTGVGQAVTIVFDARIQGQQVQVIGPDLAVVKEGVATAQPWELRLRAGLYMVKTAQALEPFTVQPSQANTAVQFG
jgi:Caspase domain